MAWQGNGMGAAWEWHALCESALIRVNVSVLESSQDSLFPILLLFHLITLRDVQQNKVKQWECLGNSVIN